MSHRSGIGWRNAPAVAATEIWPTPPESFDSDPPKKFPRPTPNVVSARPATFWFARSEMVSTL